LPPPQTHSPVGRKTPLPTSLGAFGASMLAPTRLNLASPGLQILDPPLIVIAVLATHEARQASFANINRH